MTLTSKMAGAILAAYHNRRAYSINDYSRMAENIFVNAEGEILLRENINSCKVIGYITSENTFHIGNMKYIFSRV